MASFKTDSVLHKVVKNYMTSRNIVDYSVEIEGGTSKTDGYIGDVIFFSLSYGSYKENLVLKTSKTNILLRKILEADIVYDREICMYTKVIPMLEEFTNSKKVSLINTFIPRLITNYKESIVLENLRKKDFHLWPKERPMGMAHLKLLFEKYGIWHGITMAFKDEFPEKFKKCVSDWKDSRLRYNSTFGLTSQFKREFLIVMEKLKEKGRNDLVDIFKRYEGYIDDYVYRRDLPEQDMLIISHGDSWSNNFLFKYKDDTNVIEPTQVYFLDFQLSKPESPATEIAHVLYNMGDKTCFNNSDSLLNLYHNKLSETWALLGRNPDDLLSLEDLRKHWRKYAFFSVLHTFIYARIAQCGPDESPDLETMTEHNGNMLDAFAFTLKNMDRFWERVLDVFIHFGGLLKQNS